MKTRFRVFTFCMLPFCRHFDIPVEKIAGEHMYPLQQPDLTAELIHRFIQECK